MLMFKAGVDARNMKPQVAAALITCNDVFSSFGCICMVTSLGDSKHSDGSLHFQGLAVDLRLPSRYNTKVLDIDTIVLGKLREALNEQYDVVLEGVNTPGASGAHVHVEFDPHVVPAVIPA
jgi:hypothetical protein